mgnify:CR=1 FL=1
MYKKATELSKVRRDCFTNGTGGGFAAHVLPPGSKVPGSRFQMVSQIELDPGSSIGSHLHGENEEIYWILSGEGVYNEDGTVALDEQGRVLHSVRQLAVGQELHASETIVGLTILAVGSSLPELGATISAAVRKQSDVAMGNIIGANIFRDLFAGIRDIVGGRSGSYENVLADARRQAIAEMEAEAQKLGANAVIGVDLDYEVLGSGGSMLMVSASGTAVVV